MENEKKLEELFVTNEAQQLPDFLEKSESFQQLVKLQKEGLIIRVNYEVIDVQGQPYLKLTPVWSKKAIVGNTEGFLNSFKPLNT